MRDRKIVEATARTERKDQENRELIQKLFQTLQTVTLVIIEGTVATISPLTKDSNTSRKQTKTGEELTAITSNRQQHHINRTNTGNKRGINLAQL